MAQAGVSGLRRARSVCAKRRMEPPRSRTPTTANILLSYETAPSPIADGRSPQNRGSERLRSLYDAASDQREEAPRRARCRPHPPVPAWESAAARWAAILRATAAFRQRQACTAADAKSVG